MKANFLLVICLSTLLLACGPSTQISKSWVDPSLTQATAGSFKKILIVAPLKDESSRRIAEDKLVSQITKMTAVQSYNYMKPADTDEGAFEERLKADGFDCILLMRIAQVEKSLSYTPGTSYGGWYGYRNYSPGYYSEDQTFMVETNFYSVEQNQLLWSCTTSTLNPTQFDQTLNEIIMAVKNELMAKGLIK